MARIAGVELPNGAKVDWALTLLYGVGWARASKIMNKTGIVQTKRVKDLTDEEIAKITKELDEFAPIEGELRREVRENISRLIAVGAYRGTRHSHNLPSHGQRTRTNARTKRGKRKTVGAFKKEALAKMQQKTKEVAK